jgi:S-adenosylmethionine:tRNA ribosyltransferase-isomerase
MRLEEFNYDYPRELIAREPSPERDRCKMMVLDRGRKNIGHYIFRDILDFLNEGDCLVLNDTKVVPVRLYGRRKTGGKVEIFVLNPAEKELKALVRPSKRIKDGEEIELDNGEKVKVWGKAEQGRHIEFKGEAGDVFDTGHIPLPPYIDRDDSPSDRESYQTVYAAKSGATAAPTAGLHFTSGLLDAARKKGIHTEFVTLHTGYGTFAPVKTNDIRRHSMHFEDFEIEAPVVERIKACKSSGKRVFAVGTTVTRVLESAANEDGVVRPMKSRTNLFIYPGYKFKIIDALITNFHLPGSTLLMLVSAFAGKDFILKAYREAVDERYRLFSYGDAMLIL